MSTFTYDETGFCLSSACPPAAAAAAARYQGTRYAPISQQYSPHACPLALCAEAGGNRGGEGMN